MHCLSPQTAVNFVAGALPDGPALQVEAHMAKCAECRGIVVAIAKEEAAGKDTIRDKDPQPTGAASPAARGRPGATRNPPTASKLERGSQVGRYTLLYPLGEGGMGSVFAAFDPRLDRRVALKFLRADLLRDVHGHRERLVREAQALARLSHPNVVSIFDVSDNEKSLFLAMELVDGSNARVWRELATRSTREVFDVYRQSLQALIAAHEQGIIHRDFKPDNVMIGADGIARVTDFGLARAAILEADDVEPEEQRAAWSSLTQTGIVLGTPRYMAPEQSAGISNEASDQFSYCLSFFEALYGYYPFGAKTPRQLAKDVSIEEQIIRPLGKDPVPDQLRRALLRGMSVRPEDRWPTLNALDLELSFVFRSKPKATPWFALGGIAATVAISALVFSPDPPPARDLAGNDEKAEELEILRSEMLRQKEENEKLAASQQKLLDELTRREQALKNELALAQIVEEPKPRKTVTRRELPSRSIERSVTTRLSEVLACYEKIVGPKDEESAKVAVGIAKTGKIKWVAPALTANPKAARCLEQSIARLNFPPAEGATTATLFFSFFRLDTGLLALNMRATTRHAFLGEVTIDSKGRIQVDCAPNDPLCGL